MFIAVRQMFQDDHPENEEWKRQREDNALKDLVGTIPPRVTMDFAFYNISKIVSFNPSSSGGTVLSLDDGARIEVFEPPQAFLTALKNPRYENSDFISTPIIINLVSEIKNDKTVYDDDFVSWMNSYS